ncbi:hypothetical protein HZH66_007595 [Vespula vulgaris]|uniref:Uncharacterized protein n=1 Tax=Vespula vulgaris TaxID=7454 RepID=A0A834JY72_VESVU|nr:hypothetical protein HZH66_007595 [Vespula vulgaris]
MVNSWKDGRISGCGCCEVKEEEEEEEEEEGESRERTTPCNQDATPLQSGPRHVRFDSCARQRITLTRLQPSVFRLRSLAPETYQNYSHYRDKDGGDGGDVGGGNDGGKLETTWKRVYIVLPVRFFTIITDNVRELALETMRMQNDSTNVERTFCIFYRIILL